MYIALKELLLSLFVFSVLVIPSLMAPREAVAESAQIKILGKDVNGKYPVYDVQGDLTDINYFSGDYVFRSGELMNRLKFIQKQDVNANGYECEFICKDRAGNVVGINPAFKHLGK